MAAVQGAALGQAPAELAQHLATCGRCQARLLAASAGHTGRAEASSPGMASSSSSGRLLRTVAFVVAALVLAMAALALVAILRPGA